MLLLKNKTLVRIAYILCSLWMIVCAFSVSHTSELSASEANLAVSACPLRDRLWSVPPLIQLSISKILFRVLCRQGVIYF